MADFQGVAVASLDNRYTSPCGWTVNSQLARSQQQRFVWRLALVLVTVPAGMAQTVQDMSHFEVASVKLNPDPGNYHDCTGGPGNQSPGLWICSAVGGGFLVRSAFGLEVYQYLAPSSNFDAYSISARVPQGATNEQFREMQRNLLIERFGFTWHWKDSEGIVYRIVRDPDGVKLLESAPDALAAVVTYGKPPGTMIGKDRFPILPEGVPGLVGMGGRYTVWRSSNVTIADMAWVLRWDFRTDVQDETGLTGHYDVDLRWETPPVETSPASPPYEGPDAKTVFRKRLGLRIEPAKGTIRTFVVDHIDRVPTEN